MKPKIYTAILLFISAYSPLFLILVFKDFNFENLTFRNPILDYIVIGICLLSMFLTVAIVKNLDKGNMIVTVKKVQNRSLDIINYTIPYLFCAWDINVMEISDMIIFIFFFLILLILTIRTQSIFINPLLALIGYAFYDLEYEYDAKTFSTVVISKYELHNGERYYIRSLTRFLFFIIKPSKDEEIT